MVKNKTARWAFTSWLILAGVILAFALIALLAGCTPRKGTNGDPVPQPKHTTTATRYLLPKNQKQLDGWVKKYGPPTVICNDGYVGWPAKRAGACAHHKGIGEWTGGQST